MRALRVLIDTNVLVGALLSDQGHNRAVIRACIDGRLLPIMGHTLLLEYEAVLGRSELFRRCGLSRPERWRLASALMGPADWCRVYFIWRPNLVDEGDNHLIELAVAGGVERLVTNNTQDFQDAELRFPWIRVVTPQQMMEELR